jgi:hypothetical protein
MNMKRKDIILIIEGLLKENKKQKLHITIYSNFYKFYNGFIVNYEDEDTISFIDDKLGYMIIPYSQIVNVEPFVEK